ncbi:hypothetical protein GLW08_18345 [Pontibacillus yanchengensis]|uniref:DNA-entry nuclease n=2 Tax=Pontibacillus yanchengensis TaxID=462910 RepID=A0A6I5A2M9_9BACI|nr:hypothetical protein [Pontibacillus yanchengensis]MYL35002.1 hypothetical protein [Pontibacillus yanchengensis]MYL55286.1 hypothetical protein [Pontibacillus yanchengensis]
MKLAIRAITYAGILFGGLLAVLLYVGSLKQKQRAVERLSTMTKPLPDQMNEQPPAVQPESESPLPIEVPSIPIKGNRNSRGDRIYHVPGGQFYERVTAVETFETEEEAQQKGYRRSKR